MISLPVLDTWRQPLCECTFISHIQILRLITHLFWVLRTGGFYIGTTTLLTSSPLDKPESQATFTVTELLRTRTVQFHLHSLPPRRSSQGKAGQMRKAIKSQPNPKLVASADAIQFQTALFVQSHPPLILRPRNSPHRIREHYERSQYINFRMREKSLLQQGMETPMTRRLQRGRVSFQVCPRSEAPVPIVCSPIPDRPA